MAMPNFDLISHPDFPSVAIEQISVMVDRWPDGRLGVGYIATGAIEEVIWPTQGESIFADELWKHTCFEGFVLDEASAYVEFNLAPSTQWAAYRFDSYRSGMRRALDVATSGLTFMADPTTWRAGHMRGFISFPELVGRPVWQLGLSAVIEARDGTKSYWALAHAPGQPDFHNADCFTARLTAPERA
ncbi:MAG: hypothetical protein JWM65_2767 [Sphingomonas bacterium]|nr:hypothetical protein [Sphingomonas bacterium]